MKICPFISHMIGDDDASILQIDDPAPGKTRQKSSAAAKAASDVVILGYDDESAVAVKTKPAAKKKPAANAPSHLFCLKDTCRFYDKKPGECRFETMLDQIKELNKPKACEKSDQSATDKLAKKVNKELEKFWKFQTKSVAELIASMGETDKKQQETLEAFRNRLDEGVSDIKSSGSKNEFGGLEKQVTELREAVESREEGIENFSTTVSELVLNIDDTLNSLKEKNQGLSERIDKLESTIRQMNEVYDKFESSLTDKLENLEVSQVPDDFKSMSEKFESLLETNTQINSRLDSWAESMESSIREVRDQQASWDEHLEKISGKQTEVMEIIQRDRKRFEDDSVRLRKKEAKKLNNLGVTSFHNGELELARDQFMEAVALDEEFAECYNNLGLVYTELEEEEKATGAFGRAIELNPDLPAVYNNLGYVFYKQGSYDQAIEMYNEALGRSTDNSSAYTNLGNAYFKLGNHEDAQRAWEKALEIDPSNEKASQNLKRLENT